MATDGGAVPICLTTGGPADAGGLTCLWPYCVLCQGAGTTARVLVGAGRVSGHRARLQGRGLWGGLEASKKYSHPCLSL